MPYIVAISDEELDALLDATEGSDEEAIETVAVFLLSDEE